MRNRFLLLLLIVLTLLPSSVMAVEEEEANELRVKVFKDVIDNPSLLVEAIFENVPGNTRVVDCFYTKKEGGQTFSVSPEIEGAQWSYTQPGIYDIHYWCIDEEGITASATSEEFEIGFEEEGVYVDPDLELGASGEVETIIKTQPDKAEEVVNSVNEDELKITKIEENKDLISGIITEKGLEKLKNDPNVRAIIIENSSQENSLNSPLIITVVGIILGAILGIWIGTAISRKNNTVKKEKIQRKKSVKKVSKDTKKKKSSRRTKK